MEILIREVGVAKLPVSGCGHVERLIREVGGS